MSFAQISCFKLGCTSLKSCQVIQMSGAAQTCVCITFHDDDMMIRVCLCLCVCLDGLPSMSSSGPGSAPPPSSNLTDNFAPAATSSTSTTSQQPASTKLPYSTKCGAAPTSVQPPTHSQQALPSGGIPRGGPGVMDVPPTAGFMPQQSQVFVFSTSMANQAAEAVERGLCRTIIDFHMEQPHTRHFLQVS